MRILDYRGVDITRISDIISHPDVAFAAEIEKLMKQYGGRWGEHPDYPVDDWREEVANNDTRLGYWEWVESQIRMNSYDAETRDDLTGDLFSTQVD